MMQASQLGEPDETMTIDQRAHGVVDIRDDVTGASWRALVEAQGAHHLRIRLRPSELGALPSWSPGASLDCAMEADDGRYFMHAAVTKQLGATVWIDVPTMWERHERRRAPRILGGFEVMYEYSSLQGVGACIDISSGGLRLAVTKQIPVLTRISMQFSLPGDAQPLNLEGFVVYSIAAEHAVSGYNLGVKFARISAPDAMRITTYCGA